MGKKETKMGGKRVEVSKTKCILYTHINSWVYNKALD
jgi:hypothetical protein